ncbi:alpha/beta fold hydrolase [Nocardia pseudobrasiliensis]|uniref:Alpha/beta hydrolase family protein n=1 Tax=Nocardia pseudobrasiliensis TaxID=45979 RepID=A0A370I9F0_9NOCA|nr:alpha/beta fold hydrolase [Nocardia pseudobrasiliensis]RDI66721.1 alpha/beta hydrolase family protein [Nocardia pseudobrasiliensis]
MLFRLVVVIASVCAVLSLSGADPDPSGLARFYGQRLSWQPCGIDEMDAAGAECAEVRVPLDYSRPRDRAITVAISRIRAGNGEQRRGVLLANPGGPGAEGLDTVGLLGDVLDPEVLARYDLIGMDPRGIGRSTAAPLCGWPVGEMIRSAGLSDKGFRHDTVEAAGMAATCLARDSATRRQFTTRNTARDMDVIRAALGAPALAYYGVSYGTYLGAVYTQMFPSHSDRMVFDSAIDPARYWEGMVRDWGPSDEIALDEWARWAAARDESYRLGDTPDKVRATVEELLRAVGRQPVILDGFAIDDHWLPFLLHNLVVSFRSNGVLAETIREITDAVGQPPAAARTPRLQGLLEAIRDGENSALTEIACADAGAPTEIAWYRRNIEATRVTQPVFGAMANNIQPCAFWPRPVEPATAVRNAVPALIVQAADDPRTPYAGALQLHAVMAESRLITLRDTRIHMTFRPGLSACVRFSVNAYLATGFRPAADAICDPDEPTR